MSKIYVDGGDDRVVPGVVREYTNTETGGTGWDCRGMPSYGDLLESGMTVREVDGRYVFKRDGVIYALKDPCEVCHQLTGSYDYAIGIKICSDCRNKKVAGQGREFVTTAAAVYNLLDRMKLNFRTSMEKNAAEEMRERLDYIVFSGDISKLAEIEEELEYSGFGWWGEGNPYNLSTGFPVRTSEDELRAAELGLFGSVNTELFKLPGEWPGYSVDKRLNYVYELLDPRVIPAVVFYVGKGQAGRINQHEKDAARLYDYPTMWQPRHKVIRAVQEAGMAI